MKKLIAVLLIFGMLFGAAACAAPDNSANADTTTAEAADTTPEQELDSLQARKNISDDLPEMDFNEAEFRILYQGDYNFDAGVEELTGDALNDEIYNRNKRIEERFNVKIVPISGGDSNKMSAAINKAVNAGDDAYDLCMAHIIQTGADITKGMFTNWGDIPYVDTSKPWYPQYAVSASTVNGKIYALVSDAALTSILQTYCVYFNKNIAENYNIGSSDIYGAVNGGKWTIDAMSEYVKLVYEDINGNGQKDEADLYGNKTLLFYSFNFLWAFEQPIMEVSEDSIRLVLNNEKMVNIMDRLYDFYYTQEGVYITDYMKSRTMFANSESLFLMCHFMPAMEELRSMEQDYGIVPFPKWDEQQQTHKTVVDGSFDVLAIPVSASADHYDMIGVMTEALSADSWKNVLPIFYDVALKVKGTRDAESVEMIDIILNGRVIDFSWLYVGWNGFNFIISDLLGAKKSGGDFSSYYAKNEKAKTKAYEKAFDFFF